MTDFLPWLQVPLLVAGCLFFAIGTLGLFRLSDTRDRLHALTKVDNLGLGLIALALLPSAPTLGDGAKIVLVWLVVLMASATSAHLIARAAGRDTGQEEP
ncbi:monovalent cation/H(+) antiporter subunit G [Marinobacter bryozoorum]|uniref:cation:proton antiporter n=1 Tax=Marinobacter bryozoorum TaxID=256324 RepID=UPI0020035050|nr:monovalent cation/H(+) antiporter subunit G [Marinobacter bryozoorum]